MVDIRTHEQSVQRFRSKTKMAAGVSLSRGISSTWNKLLTVVNNALVFVDNPAAEILHWSGAIKDIIDAGALAIYDISSSSRVRRKLNQTSLANQMMSHLFSFLLFQCYIETCPSTHHIIFINTYVCMYICRMPANKVSFKLSL